MTTDPHDPIDDLDALGVTVVWASRMTNAALYVRPERIMILNAQCSRCELGEAVSDLLPLVPLPRHPSPPNAEAV